MMLQLTLERIHSGKESTLGNMYIDRKWAAFVLEDQFQTQKVYGETRIPAGTYWIGLRKTGGFHKRYSQKFPDFHVGMIHIQQVPNFEYVLVHIGNDDDDTAGCLLLGDGARYSSGEATIQASTAAYRRVYPQIAAALDRGEDVVLNILDRDRVNA